MNKGFTLAEVLITLGIIGVVAALTMPALIGNYQKKVVVERLKKVYSTLKQVESRAIADYGDISGWTYTDSINSVYSDPGSAIIRKFILPYIDTVKVCEKSECPYKFSNADGTVTDLSSSVGFYLKDGTLFKINGHGSSTWGRFMIDINGDKRPNLAGRDVFFIEYDISNGQRCGKEALFCFNPWDPCYSNSKFNCYKKIMMDGWQIKSNYPWK